MTDTITITIDDADVRAVLGRLQAASVDMSGFFAVIGERLKDNIQDRIATQRSADDGVWAPLSPKYAAWKERKFPGKGILTLHGYLHDFIAWQADTDGVAIGSNRIYAATQQFGRGNIPPRPFLLRSDNTLADEDRDMILDKANRYVEDAISG